MKSEKGLQIAENPLVKLLWYCKIDQRQVRVRGFVKKIKRNIVFQYAHTRSRKSQISALVSQQSTPIETREKLDTLYSQTKKQYHKKEIPISKSWEGYYLMPLRFEFWQGSENRPHDRIVYKKMYYMENI